MTLKLRYIFTILDDIAVDVDWIPQAYPRRYQRFRLGLLVPEKRHSLCGLLFSSFFFSFVLFFYLFLHFLFFFFFTFLQYIGFCSQFDTLWDQLTVSTRGVSPEYGVVGRHAESCVYRIVRQMIGWNKIYYNPISLISVMVWTASVKYNHVFFFSYYIHCITP